MEFVLVDAPALDGIVPQPSAFSSYFSQNKLAVSFENLGRDAKLIAPCPTGKTKARVYSSIAPFTREASNSQIDFFWTLVGAEGLSQLGNAPFWLSTSGLGVYWLHARLDQRPKYYQYGAYKIANA